MFGWVRTPVRYVDCIMHDMMCTTSEWKDQTKVSILFDWMPVWFSLTKMKMIIARNEKITSWLTKTQTKTQIAKYWNLKWNSN